MNSIRDVIALLLRLSNGRRVIPGRELVARFDLHRDIFFAGAEQTASLFGALATGGVMLGGGLLAFGTSLSMAGVVAVTALVSGAISYQAFKQILRLFRDIPVGSSGMQAIKWLFQRPEIVRVIGNVPVADIVNRIAQELKSGWSLSDIVGAVRKLQAFNRWRGELSPEKLKTFTTVLFLVCVVVVAVLLGGIVTYGTYRRELTHRST
jgi:hypothetical protein